MVSWCHVYFVVAEALVLHAPSFLLPYPHPYPRAHRARASFLPLCRSCADHTRAPSTPGLVLVTDAMAAMGLEQGEHRIGEITVFKDGKDKVVVSGTETLAGRYDSPPPRQRS